MDPISKTFVKLLEDFAKREKVPVVRLSKGQGKDNVAAEHRKKSVREGPALLVILLDPCVLVVIQFQFLKQGLSSLNFSRSS